MGHNFTDQTEAPRPRAPWSQLAIVVVIALAVRAVAVEYFASNLDADPDAYRAIATTLSGYGVFGQAMDTPTGVVLSPTAFRPPLYPLVLALLSDRGRITTRAIAGLHCLLGAATAALVFWLGLRWSGERLGWGAATLVILDPILLQQATFVMTETLATFLAAAVLWAATRLRDNAVPPRAVTLGVLCGLASLCRPTFLPFAGLLGALLLLAPEWRRARWQAVPFAVGLGLALAPWVVRNTIVFGQPIATTTHGGYTLLLGNNPEFYRYLRSAGAGEVWEPAAFHEAWQRRPSVADPARLFEPHAPGAETNPPTRRNEIEEDRFAYAAARAAIEREPWSFVTSCFVRLGWFWRPTPQRTDSHESNARRWARSAIGCWYVAVYLFALRGIVRLKWKALSGLWCWGLLLCLTFSALHLVYWSNLRMRAPLMPFISLLAACGWGYVPRGERVCRRGPGGFRQLDS